MSNGYRRNGGGNGGGNGGQRQNGNGQRSNGNGGGNGNGGKKDPPVLSIGPCVTGSGNSVSAAVWETVMQKDGGGTYSLYRISVQSSYYSEDDKEWKHGSSFAANQLSALAYCLGECSRYVFANSIPQQNGDVPN